MAEFSARERLIAAILSKTPGLKRKIKRLYVKLNAVMYKKPYAYKILDNRVEKLHVVSSENNYNESFFGYYDKCCCWDERVLWHCCSLPSTKLPNAEIPCSLILKNLETGETQKIGDTYAYNWQQGCRMHWLNKDRVLYNVFDGVSGTYKAVLYAVRDNKELCRYEKPVQESYGTDFFLAINYTRLWTMRPDYCYRCIPKLTKTELADMDNDGIWRVDMETGAICLLHSFNDVIRVDYRSQFDKCVHNVNHVMLSPNGKRMIFIHRNYLGKQRFDRLMLSDFVTLKVVIDEHYVSHCCWIDDDTILGYLKSGNERGFYFIDVDTLNVRKCEEMCALKSGDGHPSFNGRFVAFDSYPDKSRMQKLYIYDTKKKIVFPLLELFQSSKYEEETRCDLHPRFSNNGRKIFFDTVYRGHRDLCYVDISSFYD